MRKGVKILTSIGVFCLAVLMSSIFSGCGSENDDTLVVSVGGMSFQGKDLFIVNLHNVDENADIDKVSFLSQLPIGLGNITSGTLSNISLTLYGETIPRYKLNGNPVESFYFDQDGAFRAISTEGKTYSEPSIEPNHAFAVDVFDLSFQVKHDCVPHLKLSYSADGVSTREKDVYVYNYFCIGEDFDIAKIAAKIKEVAKENNIKADQAVILFQGVTKVGKPLYTISPLSVIVTAVAHEPVPLTLK